MGRISVFLLAVSFLALAAAPAAHAEACGQVDFDYRTQGEKVEGAVTVAAVAGIDCTASREVVKQCGTESKVPGWTATGTAVRFELRRGDKVIVVKGLAGAAPRCAPAKLSSPPRYPTRRCGNALSGPDEPGFNILARGVSCTKARKLTREQIRGGCPADPSACDIDGFSCSKRSTGDLYRVQCRRGRRSFSWGGGS